MLLPCHREGPSMLPCCGSKGCLSAESSLHVAVVIQEVLLHCLSQKHPRFLVRVWSCISVMGRVNKPRKMGAQCSESCAQIYFKS